MVTTQGSTYPDVSSKENLIRHVASRRAVLAPLAKACARRRVHHLSNGVNTVVVESRVPHHHVPREPVERIAFIEGC